MDLLNKLKNLIKIGKKSDSVDEQTIEVEYYEKKQKALLILPYGTHCNTPNDIAVIILQQDGSEDSLLAFSTDINNRDELEEKEVAYGIPTLKTRIKFDKDGNIIFQFEDKNATDYAVRFEELKKGFDEFKDDFNDFINTKYNTHTHDVAGVMAGSSTATASPTSSSGSQTNAKIDDAKIEEIKMPEK